MSSSSDPVTGIHLSLCLIGLLAIVSIAISSINIRRGEFFKLRNIIFIAISITSLLYFLATCQMVVDYFFFNCHCIDFFPALPIVNLPLIFLTFKALVHQ